MSSAFPGWPRTSLPSSLWRSTATEWAFAAPRTDIESDVIIVGAGFTGLWTAAFLTDIDPTLSVTVLDAMQPGYGASGRNGGWCSALMPASLDTIATESSREDATNLQRCLADAIGDIGSFIDDNGIECGWRHGGTLSIGTNSAQMSRARTMIEQYRSYGFDDDFIRMVGSGEAEDRVRTGRAHGGWFSPHCAAVNPLGLVDGLVGVLVARGVTIHGSSIVRSVGTRSVELGTPETTLRASGRWIVLATEGFTAALPGYRRILAPIHSYMVATEPLPDDVWRSIGWSGRETFADGRHVVIYAQRTSDDRIAFGGRGAPYSFGSRVGPDHDTNGRIHGRIIETMRHMFPAVSDAAITHRWGGALGAPRDWHPGVRIDRTRGVAMIGGYVGDGVALAHLAGRAAAHCMMGTGDPSTRLPIVDHVSPRWEPEPFRWMGINAMLRLGSIVDGLEARESRLARLGERVLDSVLG